MKFRRGFTLVEMAVVLAIVGFLLAGAIYALGAQIDQRNFEETRRRLDQARELVLAFAVVNGRLPCPARSAATNVPATVMGDEVRNAAGQCSGDHGAGAMEDYYGGTAGAVMLGLLPARTIGFQHVDQQGFAVDAWNNRIRYAVAKTVTGCAGAVNPHWVISANLRQNGIACQPGDLLVCKSTAVAPAISAASCGGAVAGANQIMSQNLVSAVIFSTGKNYLANTAGNGADEMANLNGGGNVDPVFVYHLPTPDFDDQFTWITAGEVYGRLIAAGVLP